MPPSDPFFSIVIPTFNSQGSIDRCIKSVLAQSFSSYEILVIDGQSTDATMKIVGGYNDRGTDLRFVSENDAGTYDAMNKGIGLAKGTWLYFLGSDDELHDGSVLSRVAEHISAGRGRVFYGSVLVVGNSGWANDGDIYDGPFSTEKLILKNICHQAIFYHRELFSDLGLFNINYRVCADFDFNLRAAAATGLSYVPVTVARFWGGGISSKKDHVFFEDHPYLLVSYFKSGIFATDFRKAINYLAKAYKMLLRKREFVKLVLLATAVIWHNTIRLFRGRQA